MDKITTLGVDHVGLTVNNLEQTESFFVNCLGWSKVGEKPEYPASFVSDGNIMISLWQAFERDELNEFNRKRNIGLHHIAFKAKDLESLNKIFEDVKNWEGVVVEFPPEQSASGSRTFFMINEPGGIRIEFSYSEEAVEEEA